MPEEADAASHLPQSAHWVLDPESTWWMFTPGAGESSWRFEPDLSALHAAAAPDQITVYRAPAAVEMKLSEALGCWVRPAGQAGSGRWVVQREAAEAWKRGDELWWPGLHQWARRVGELGDLPTKQEELITTNEPVVPAAPKGGPIVVEGYEFVAVPVDGEIAWVGPPISWEQCTQLDPSYLHPNPKDSAILGNAAAAELANFLTRRWPQQSATTEGPPKGSLFYTVSGVGISRREETQVGVRIASPLEILEYALKFPQSPDGYSVQRITDSSFAGNGGVSPMGLHPSTKARWPLAPGLHCQVQFTLVNKP